MTYSNLALIPQPDNVVPFPTKNQEWYTPSVYIEAARLVMNGIGLDPASCELANKTVKAERFYTEKQNGLERDWTCKSMWLNPPFGTVKTPYDGSAWQGTSVARLFIRKLLEDFKEGKIEQAILLAKADPKQNWFHLLWEYLICFACDNVYFTRPDGPAQRNQFGVCFVYLGENTDLFTEVFEQFGTVARRVSQPKRAVMPLSLWEGV
jgi:DNA N-6-adenine-methyltransferase (Dam)